MLTVQVRRCSILHEFTGEQQQRFFGISRDKTIHHVDTLYYAVNINEPDNIVELQANDALPENLAKFLQMLRDTKAYTSMNYSDSIEFDDGMEYARKAFSIYEFCISKNECFDIFISSYVPTEETPRIVVQLRSRFLVLEGVRRAVEESLIYLRKFLEPYGLFPVKIRENRIDYAYHTNLIQNPYKFFSDDCLVNHLKTNLRCFAKYGKITDHGIELETLTLGNRKSNNVYFRGYNKCQEIIRMNYKSFFFQRWRDHGLISEFDQYVYQVAYDMKSYRAGVLVGRIRWYLEYGTNEDLKEYLRDVLVKNHIKSDNCTNLEKELKNVIPEPTLIFNVEFQTKRKFYTTCGDWLGLHDVIDDPVYPRYTMEPYPTDPRVVTAAACDPLLRDLFFILANGKEIMNYLTGFGNTVSFVENRNVSFKQFKKAGEPYMNWWKRIRSTPVEYSSPEIMELYRKYDVRASFSKTRRLLSGQVARLAMIANESTEERTFEEDLADALCYLNDNDFKVQYMDIRKRKARQLRGILPKGEPQEKLNCDRSTISPEKVKE